jgi:cell division protein FtsW (lipid II flippase)
VGRTGGYQLTGLPVPPTDSIFAVVGEETGFAGAFALLSLYPDPLAVCKLPKELQMD